MTTRDAKVALLLGWPLLCLGGVQLVRVFQRPAVVSTRFEQPIEIVESAPPAPESDADPYLPPEPIAIVLMPAEPNVPSLPPPLPVPPPPVPEPPPMGPVVVSLSVVQPPPVRIRPPEPTPPRPVTEKPVVPARSVVIEKPPETILQVVHVESLPPVRQSPRPNVVPHMPLTGCVAAELNPRRGLMLPSQLRDQLGKDAEILVSPGTSACLWLTTPAYLAKMTDRLDGAEGVDVHAFRRLFFAQATPVNVKEDGNLEVPERLAAFAGLHREVVLIGVDDHIEVWDATRWRRLRERMAREE